MNKVWVLGHQSIQYGALGDDCVLECPSYHILPTRLAPLRILQVMLYVDMPRRHPLQLKMFNDALSRCLAHSHCSYKVENAEKSATDAPSHCNVLRYKTTKVPNSKVLLTCPEIGRVHHSNYVLGSFQPSSSATIVDHCATRISWCQG